ncbi:hypothetical protein [Streptomyces violascens]|uniref:hypothetical protein n=1 Tax=Streptomyces violascens TaxID=67381 RepID=UPI003660789B
MTLVEATAFLLAECIDRLADAPDFATRTVAEARPVRVTTGRPHPPPNRLTRRHPSGQ